jgi:hypothetical protein
MHLRSGKAPGPCFHRTDETVRWERHLHQLINRQQVVEGRIRPIRYAQSILLTVVLIEHLEEREVFRDVIRSHTRLGESISFTPPRHSMRSTLPDIHPGWDRKGLAGRGVREPPAPQRGHASARARSARSQTTRAARGFRGHSATVAGPTPTLSSTGKTTDNRRPQECSPSQARHPPDPLPHLSGRSPRRHARARRIPTALRSRPTDRRSC